MWLLYFIPDFIFHILLLVGLLILVASFVLDSIPFVSTNAKAIQLAGTVVFTIAVFFEGAIIDNNAWKARVQALELKVAQAETKSAEANAQLVSKLTARQKEIAASQSHARSRIEQIAPTIDAVCPVPATVISILNDAAGSKK